MQSIMQSMLGPQMSRRVHNYFFIRRTPIPQLLSTTLKRNGFMVTPHLAANSSSQHHRSIKGVGKGVEPKQTMTPLHQKHHVKADSQGLVTLEFPNGEKTVFHSIWLRDHCRCQQCYHSITKQRLLDTSKADSFHDFTKKIVSITHRIDRDVQVHVEKAYKVGANDGHTSVFDLSWLRAHSYYPNLSKPSTPKSDKNVYWGSELKENLPTVLYKDVIHTELGVQKWLENVDKYGIGFVSGCPPTAADTEKIARRIAFIRESHYGGFWEFTANMAHGDTAYTNIALGAHTDTTYFTDPVGLQLFQLLEHQGTGGESLYVDGFHCARLLKKQDPKAYETLSKTLLHAHASGDKSTIIKPAIPFPILNHHPLTKQLYQIRWNNDDRDVLSHLSGPQVQEFYRALQAWMSIVQDKKNELWVKLTPGLVVVVDNWRVFHGRNSFTGLRRMCGGYLNRDDWKGRLLRLHDKNK